MRREALAAVLNRDGVVAASLFGSQAAGRTGPLSDVDLAVWLDPALSCEARSALRRELLAAAIHVLGTDEVDLVVLNDAPPLLQHRVLRDGVRLVERDARARVRLDSAALIAYLDTAWLRSTLADGRRRRLEEDRFGRR